MEDSTQDTHKDGTKRALDALDEFAAFVPNSRSTAARRVTRLLDHGDATDSDPESIPCGVSNKGRWFRRMENDL